MVQVTRTDGVISDDEMKMLYKEGRKFGLTEPEIDNIIKSEAHYNYTPPYSLNAKFINLYNIAQVIMADGMATDAEQRLMKKFAIEAGFDDKTIEKLLNLLFEGIKKGEDEEVLFAEFKRKHLFKD